MKHPHYMRGMGTAGWIFLVLIVGGIITTTMKLAPLYIDHNTMSSIIDAMANEQGIVEKRTQDIDAMIKKRFKLNSIRDFDFKNNMKITRPGDKVIVTLDYEVRMPLIQNIDLIASFDHTTEMRN